MIVYLDASVAVATIKEEPASARIQAWLDDLDSDMHLLISGRLLETELRRTAVRQGISQEVVNAALRPIALIDHERVDFRLAGTFADSDLGSLEALHLATAMRARADAMVTHDKRLARASRAQGLDLLLAE